MASAALDFDHSLGNSGAARDSTGCLAVVGHFLEPLGPCLVLLADGDGEVIAADSLGSELGAGAAAGLARSLAIQLRDRNAYRAEILTELGARLTFAVRLPLDSHQGILGGLVQSSDRCWRGLGELQRTIAECGKLAWIAVQSRLEATQSQAQVGRLLAKQAALEAQLAQAQKLRAIGQLAAGIAHEINTPTQYIGDNIRFLRDALDELRPLLTACSAQRAIRGSATVSGDFQGELAAGTQKPDVDFLLGEIPAAIAQSLEGVERVAKIVRSIKEFSHPDGGDKQAIDLNRAIESTLTISHNEWKYVADAVTDLDPDLPPVTCVPGDLNQVLLNLIVNAAHAIEAKQGDSPSVKGTITIRTRRDGPWVEIEVQDTGSGIPEAIRAKVFDRFFTTKQTGRGTGQGLAIARTIIERHGGTIAFDTEVGRGTTFKVRIPIYSQSTSVEGDGDEAADPGCG